VAEWLRSGLQNRLRRFNSGRGLHNFNDLAGRFETLQIYVSVSFGKRGVHARGLSKWICGSGWP
jgi:hypothetical protein